MDRKIKVIYNKLENIAVNNKGYIDLNNSKVEKKEDFINICNIFRNPRYETFRVIYIKDNKIIGQESVTSKIPNVVLIFSNGKRCESNPIKTYEKMNDRIKRLNAEGYYLVHNHCSFSSKPSQEDMDITREFDSNVNGFLGHIVLGCEDRYSIIEKNSYGLIKVLKEKSISREKLKEIGEKLEENTLYGVKISCREDLVAILKQIQNEKDYSIAVLTDTKCGIRMVLDILNKMFNQKPKNLKGFFENIARNNGVTRVFIGTQNKETYNKILEHQQYGTIKDMVYFDEEKREIFGMEIGEDLFDKEKVKRKDREER